MSRRTRERGVDYDRAFPVRVTFVVVICVYPAFSWLIPFFVGNFDPPLGPVLAGMSKSFAPALAVAAFVTWLCGVIERLKVELAPPLRSRRWQSSRPRH